MNTRFPKEIEMTTTNAERLRTYRAKMDAAGFKRLSIYAHPDLIAFLKRVRKPTECGGRTLERLLLGTARARPLCDWGK
jgi:hypothetical protein